MKDVSLLTKKQKKLRISLTSQSSSMDCDMGSISQFTSFNAGIPASQTHIMGSDSNTVLPT